MFKGELQRFHAAARQAGRILITATEREDGDSIAAELAVKHILEQSFHGAGKVVHVVNERPCPARYLFLKGAAEILPVDRVAGDRYDLGIVLDCGADRAGRVRPLFMACPVRVKIDHHSFGNAGAYDIEICTNQVASTTEILFAFVDDPTWRTPLGAELANLIYVGILCDTGSFQYDLTRPSSHRVAARLLETGFNFPDTAERVHLVRSFAMKKLLGLVLNRMERAPHGRTLWSVMSREMVRAADATADDTGDIIDEICFINGVEVTLLFVEQPDGSVRISFRSRGGVNVGEFARGLTPLGGGHPRASGCLLPGPVDAAIATVLARLDDLLRRQGLIG
jgi:phosphoesterase RecJ-like protein